MADLAGRQIGRYRFVEEVGRGGMAQVYKAIAYFAPERWVAIKVLSDQHNASEEVRARLQQEAQIQCRLSHPNIGQVLGVIDEDGIFALVMEWIAGVDLRMYMRQQKLFGLSVEQIQVFFLPILEAMAFVHRHNIVHRDIKPANIMLHMVEDRITPKILDFGIAKMLESSIIKTKEGALLGTIAYISPEQIRGLPPTPSMDIYSLGISLYELLVGRPPFRGGYTDVLIAHTETAPDDIRNYRSDLPDGLNAIVMRALAKEPADRFPTCDAFRQALEDLFDQTINLNQAPRSRTVPMNPKEIREMIRAIHGFDPADPNPPVGPPPDLFPRLAALSPPPSSSPSPSFGSGSSSTPSQTPYPSDLSSSLASSQSPYPSAYPVESFAFTQPNEDHDITTDPMPATQQIPAEALEILYPSAKSPSANPPSSERRLSVSVDSSPSLHGYIPQPRLSSESSDAYRATVQLPFDERTDSMASHSAFSSPSSLADTAPVSHHESAVSVAAHNPSTSPPPSDAGVKTGIVIGLAVGVLFSVAFFVIFSFLR